MSAFDQCSKVAARSLQLLDPFLQETHGRYVLTDKGRHSRAFQETFGDLIFNASDGRMFTVELKAEERWTGNLFLEIWSNCNFTPGESYRQYGPNPGWLAKMNADLLFYHFVDQDRLVICSLPRLQHWSFIAKSQNRSSVYPNGQTYDLHGRAYDFRQRSQKQHQQKNITVGALVPIEVLRREMSPPPKVVSVRQLTLDLFGKGEAA